MRPGLSRKFKTLALICLFSSLAGVVYQLINEKLVDHRSVMLGIPLGLVFSLIELFILPKANKVFRQWPFTKLLVFKTLLYTLAIYFVSLVMATIAGLAEGRQLSELFVVLSSVEQFVLVFYALIVYGLLVFFLQINLLLGEGVIWKYLRGKYHKPREEERIFMFLDMKSSTTIAEHLGHVRFYALLNELFHEISQPVLQTKAEIYQYIGDEVVLTWEVEHGLEDSNCLKSFFMFQESLLRNKDNYQKKFGLVPEFKAGMHYGKVISAQIGDLKKEIIYNGDVLNTTARIQSECNTYQRDCLVSGDLMKRLFQDDDFNWEKLDTVILRGKDSEIELYSVSRQKKTTVIHVNQVLTAEKL